MAQAALHYDYTTVAEADRQELVADALAYKRRDQQIDAALLANAAVIVKWKARLPHGQFTDWVKTELGVTPRKAQMLMKTWRLPELLITITDHHRTSEARVRNVLLAVQLARHTQLSWDNPAIPDDIAAIAMLLNLSPEAAQRKAFELGEL